MLTILNKILDTLNSIKKINIAKDTAVMGMFSGLLGVLALETLNILMGKKFYFSRIAATMLSNRFGSTRMGNILLGFIMSLTVGAGVGSVFTGLLKLTGKSFLLLKSIFVSLSAWVCLFSYGNKINLFGHRQRKIKDNYSAFLQHILFGLIMSLITRCFCKTNRIKLKANKEISGQAASTCPSSSNTLFAQVYE